MWRRNAAGFGNEARENEDSDQSISEEDEGLDGEWTRDAISLGGGDNDKGKMQVLSQLELFRESCTEESISSHGKRGGYKMEDEVEPPIFNDGSSPSRYHGIASATLAHSNKGLIYLQDVPSISYSDEEIISDEEKTNLHTFRSVRENLAITWSEASRELEALVRSNENPCCSSNHHDVFVKEKKSTKGGGGRRKAKAKFSFPCHSETSSDNILIEDEIGAVADEEMHNNMADSQLNIHDKHILPFEMAHKHETRGHSMAEILSGFLERSDLQEGSSGLEIQKRRREHAVLVRNAPPLGDSIQEDNDLPETLDSDTSFESEDENAQSVKSIISRTVADQFHEAFGTVSAIDDTLHVSFPRPLRGGIYRKLQQVMQIEKERDVDSLKNASADTSFKDEGLSILVRILSRSLEAKLIVCSCTCVEDGKNLSSVTRTMTIIFKPRMSNDADLEVGNLIRVHPPWKEVQVKDEGIFLCSYFSQVRRGADRAEIYSLAFSPTAQWLAVSSDKGTVHVFSLKVNSGNVGSERSNSPPDTSPSAMVSGSSLSFIKGVLPKYFSSEWSVAQFRLPEGYQYIVAFGHQKNTVVILGLDGSFYRCKFEPGSGGEMTQLEYHNFLKPEEAF